MIDMFHKTRLRRLATIVPVAAGLAICGCTDLGEISQFAKASADVGKQFSVMADAAKESCIHANSFNTPNNSLKPLDCTVYDTLNVSLIKVNDSLFNYIASLGKLATTDLSKVPGGLDKLSADLKQADPSISASDQARASAAGGLAKAITNIWANGYRQHDLEKIIGENDAAVNDVEKFLSEYAADKYHQAFSDELRYETSYCTGVISAAEPLASDILIRSCARDEIRIKKNLNAVAAYQQALATVSATHKKLSDERGHWDIKQLSKEIGPEIVSLGSSAVAMNKAF
jgi:hypothetical protein